jgi:hypothetical protein
MRQRTPGEPQRSHRGGLPGQPGTKGPTRPATRCGHARLESRHETEEKEAGNEILAAHIYILYSQSLQRVTGVLHIGFSGIGGHILSASGLLSYSPDSTSHDIPFLPWE